MCIITYFLFQGLFSVIFSWKAILFLSSIEKLLICDTFLHTLNCFWKQWGLERVWRKRKGRGLWFCSCVGYKSHQRRSKQNKQFADTGNTVLVVRGDRRWGEQEEGEGGQIYADGRRLDFGWWTHNAIYTYVWDRIVYLKHIIPLTNVTQ